MNVKIEKLNDNQIRCTLTRADLMDRQIKLSELVCGGEKAKSLFQEMMHQASDEFGFEAEDTPLMIEAVPAASDSIVLIITKVDDPEELDSKFSKFGALAHEMDSKKKAVLDKMDEEQSVPGIRLFSFANIDCVIHTAHLLNDSFKSASTLYKDTPNNVYLLALAQGDYSTSEFNKICNMFSEYGAAEKTTYAILAYLEEHCDVIVAANAVAHLACI